MNKQDFLLEIGCEELPARFLKRLSKDLSDVTSRAFTDENLSFDSIKTYVTPRRLAILVNELNADQTERKLERHGPFVKDAYDKDGTPTLACIGFARSCGIAVDQLQKQETPKGERVCVVTTQPGLPATEVLGPLVEKALKKLPLPKPMRWGSGDLLFLRPVKWVVMMLGKTLIDATILGQKTTTKTQGHRFHYPKSITITEPKSYNETLYTNAYVVADFEKRREIIESRIKQAAAPDKVVIDPKLLDEVTGLVEWPVALKGGFSENFLKLPRDILITSMKTHQKCFPVENADGKLQPYFILVSNIESKDPKKVISGNERVIHARLSDAEFFYQNDLKTPLSDRLKTLDSVVFQQKLGTLGDKVKRLTKLSGYIAKTIDADTDTVKQGAQLAKCDLVTEVVFEFPNLQGIAGYDYAIHDKVAKKTADIIKEHYQPIFSGDTLPNSKESACVALADRLDTLVGIIGINKKPTGDKDPFGLRRSALGIIRILIEKSLDMDLTKLVHQAVKTYAVELPNKNVEDNVCQFILERLKYWYTGNDIPVGVFDAVLSTNTTNLLDFNKRIKAVLEFQKLPEAEALAAANKRVGNILKKQNKLSIPKSINAKHLSEPAEETLAALLKEQASKVAEFYDKQDYTKALTTLACLKEPIDDFFDNVMVMDKDEKKRNNRLALLARLRELFSKTADISVI